MTLPLTDRTAIVTGATRGLGLEIARGLVAAGARVVVTGREPSALDAAAAEFVTVRADVADPEACAQVVAAAEERFGPLTALVNNAGVYGPMGPIEAVDWDAWVEAVRINLFGTVLMCRAVVPGMRARGYGKIINLSGGGATAPMPADQRLRGVQGGGRAHDGDARRGVARHGRGRQRDRSRRAEHPHARRAAGGRAGARRRRRPREGDQAARRRRRAVRAGCAARRVPRLGGERRHQRAARGRAVG